MRLFRLVTEFLTSFFKGGKGFLLRKLNYERIIDSFRSCDYKRRLQYIVRYAARLFSTRILVLGGFVWVLTCPVVLRAELSNTDSQRLLEIRNTVDYIHSVNQDIYNRAGDIFDEINLYANKDSNNINSIKTNVQSINSRMIDIKNNTSNITNVVSKLDVIISYLEQLSEDESSGSSSTNTVSITQDWLKEDTFKESFGGFVEKYDSFLNSWGFSGGSSGETLKSYLDDKFDFNKSYSYKSLFYEHSAGVGSPFPGNKVSWPLFIPGSFKLSSTNWVSAIIESQFKTSDSERELMYYLGRKQSWNDWQAHTNLIEKLDSIYRLDGQSDLQYNEETGEVTLTQIGTGSSSESSEVIEVTPVSTNTVDTAVTSITDTEVVVTDFFDKEVIQTRYINSSLLEVGQDYGIGESVGATSSGVLVTEWFTIDFSVWGESYRRYLTQERLRSWREIAGYLWTLASVVLCVILVRKWGNM